MNLNQKGQKYHDFEVKRVLDIEELKCKLIELEHTPTGATVMHLANEDPENLFCLSLRTYPDTSNGVAHILEHTVLCGSEKFPVKDPFFSMTRRSLNTFMNAMTGGDFTCYPAASQVEKDFYNLLDVYIDAVFKPKLKELSFLQEGHRFEFADPIDPSSPLEYKGIVFNEMKGGMSTMGSRMGEAMHNALLPDLTYGVNSGGNPKVIPELTYQQLLDFHRTYYHPSRCVFFFYGNMPLEDHLDFIAENALKGVERLPDLAPIPKQKRYEKPIRREVPYPIAKDEDPSGKTMITFAWLTSHIKEQEDLLAQMILDSVLMDTDASPLKIALLKSGYCKQAYSDLYDHSSEIQYSINFKGCDPENADALEKVLFDTLGNIVKEGIPPEQIENAMHQLEIQRSEISGDGYPFGLILFMRAAVLKQRGGKPEDALTIHEMFRQLREALKKDPRYLEKKLQHFLIDNMHRARIVLLPDPELTTKEDAEERAKLDAIREKMTEEEVQRVVKQAAELKQFQKEQEEVDHDILPKVTLADVPKESRDYPLSIRDAGKLKVFHHPCFTNSIMYADLVHDLPEMAEEDLSYLSLFSSLLPQVGCGGRSYAENLEYMHANTGGIGCHLSLHIQAEDYRKFAPSLSVYGKALHRKVDKFFPLLHEMVTSADLTDVHRLKEIILKKYTGLQSSLVGAAMKYAMNQASCGFDLAAKISDHWSGLSYFQTIRDLAENFDVRADQLVEKLQMIQQTVLGLEHPHLVLGCNEEMAEQLIREKFYGLQDLATKEYAPWKGDYPVKSVGSHACDIGTPVAFSSMAFKTFPYAHPETPAVKVAGQLFDNVTLHTQIREQGGAYGGGATNNSSSGNFYFYAYRDPNIARSIQAFSDSVEGILKGEFTDSDLEEAKLEIIQGLDSPVSPGSRSDVAYAWWREGKSKAVRQAFRDQLIALTRDEVIAAVREHILPKMPEATFVTFAGADLVNRENKAMATPLPIEKI